MASLARDFTDDKLTGRVYTPPEIVARILDAVGYHGDGVTRRRVLDPACGDGQFLTEVVRRIVDATPPAARAAALSLVHGWDIDADAVEACRRRLGALVAPLTIDWNVRVRNALDALPDGDAGERFDVVVGNPPYVRIQHLSEADRRTVQTRFALCRSGSTDLYIAFFELALALLAPGGRGGYVTPNTYFHTAAGAALRARLAAGRHVRHVVDYGARQVFPGVTTYAAITVLGAEPAAQFDYVDASGEPGQAAEATRTVEALATRGPWRFGAGGSALDPERFRPLRELARVRVGLATLADRVFIGTLADPDAFQDADGAVTVRFKDAGDVPIERGLLRRIVKGSKVRLGEPAWRGEVIVFPYERLAGTHRLMPERGLAARFPLGWAYLRSVRPRLDQRDNGRPNAVGWYAFGRTQALDTAFGPKILCPPMAKVPTFVVDRDPDATLYSGYFITSDHDLDALAAQLTSSRMDDWVRTGSRDYQGGWKGYSKASFQDFPIDVTVL